VSKRLLIAIAFLASFISCHKSDNQDCLPTELSKLKIPAGFPAPEFPEDNKFTNARWELGKKLFFDPVMSRDESISCSSCHKAALAFSDDVALTSGVDNLPGTRNSPTLTNVAYQPYYTREGGIPTLEMQVAVPVQEHNEFDFNMVLIAERLLLDEVYVDLSMEAYDVEPSTFVITRALACFERSMISGESPADSYDNGNFSALSNVELEGRELFFNDEIGCAECHGGMNYTSYNFENNGLYEVYADSGRYRLTLLEDDIARFKVPTLRNIEMTAPYMHDGSLSTLEDVVDHYSAGGNGHFNQSPLVTELDLSVQEKSALISFLKALTDSNFITDERFQN
jgi:cytochrome c peroxidase